MNVRMTKFRLTVILVIMVTAVVVGNWLYTDSSGSDGGSRLFGQRDGTAFDKSEMTEFRQGRKRDRPEESADLVKLKERWKAMGASLRTRGFTAENQQAARDSVQRLLCGHETLELIKFMKENEISCGVDLINEAVSELLRSPRAAEARASLIGLTEGEMVKMNANPLEEWCYAAGSGCTNEELNQFCAEMTNNRLVVEALLGRNLVIADTDARQALSSSLKLLVDKKNQCQLGSVSLMAQIKKLPLDSDFKEIERLFPVEKEENRTDHSDIWSGYGDLFRRWAEKDPAAAANFVIESPERAGSDKISIIAGVVARGDPLVALEWVQNFPEGPGFDMAASGIISYINDEHPKEALELAALISEPKLREKAINDTEIKQRATRNREAGAGGR